MNTKMEFFANVPQFKAFSRRMLKTFMMSFQNRIYKWSNIIYREGEEAEEVYIVKSGELKVYYYLLIFVIAKVDFLNR